MRITTRGVGGEPHLFQRGVDPLPDGVETVDFQRFGQGTPQRMVGVQRGIGILKHHLHVAAQLALKTNSGSYRCAKQLNAAAPLAL